MNGQENVFGVGILRHIIVVVVVNRLTKQRASLCSRSSNTDTSKPVAAARHTVFLHSQIEALATEPHTVSKAIWMGVGAVLYPFST